MLPPRLALHHAAAWPLTSINGDALPWISRTFPWKSMRHWLRNWALAIARKCGNNNRNWQTANALGIPWRRKSWSSLRKLQSAYNEAVQRTPTLAPVEEHTAAALSGSASSQSETIHPSHKFMVDVDECAESPKDDTSSIAAGSMLGHAGDAQHLQPGLGLFGAVW